MTKDRPDNAFAAERERLEEAQRLMCGRPEQAELETAFRKLAADYEKLLKTAVKISRISDIQGRMLKEREQELREAGDSVKLAETQRKKLMSDISHELGTPMTSIQGYVKAMIDRVIAPEPEFLQLIYDKAQFVNRLVADLFQLSRLEANKFPFEFLRMTPAELLNPYAGKFEVDARKAGVRLTMSPLAGGAGSDGRMRWHVKADPYRIEQVMTNFVHNALKFTPKGGEIRIESEVHAAAYEAVQTRGAGSCALTVRVIDTGIGIRGENLPLVFERFYRVRNKGSAAEQGTGLGLAISKEIIVQHQGMIGVTSEPGQGSAFFFTLPLTEPTEGDTQ